MRFKEYLKESGGDLLATSPTEEGIIKLISKFYMGSTINLKPIDNKTYEVHNKNGLITATKVIKKGKRFRFERI